MKKMKIALVLLMSFLILVFACTTPQSTTPPSTCAGPECSPSASTAASSPSAILSAGTTHQVVIEDFKFAPADVEIKVGDTVEWANKDSIDHTITLENGEVDELILSGATIRHTFITGGTFSYHCGFHPSMRGTVAVAS